MFPFTLRFSEIAQFRENYTELRVRRTSFWSPFCHRPTAERPCIRTERPQCAVTWCACWLPQIYCHPRVALLTLSEVLSSECHERGSLHLLKWNKVPRQIYKPFWCPSLESRVALIMPLVLTGHFMAAVTSFDGSKGMGIEWLLLSPGSENITKLDLGIKSLFNYSRTRSCPPHC